jgi:hypothetical protein
VKASDARNVDSIVAPSHLRQSVIERAPMREAHRAVNEQGRLGRRKRHVGWLEGAPQNGVVHA